MSVIIRESPDRTLVAPWLVLALSSLILLLTVYLATSDASVQAGLIRRWGFLASEYRWLWSTGVWWRHPDMLVTPVTALLLHAGWLHLLGNIAYLWAFGLSVERHTGHLTLALIFLLAGAGSNIALIWELPGLQTPVIGSSGGVSGLIGCYLVLFPRRRMGLYLPLGLYMKFARLPSLFVILSWFLLQVIYSLQGPLSGNIIWHVHMIGFFGGMAAGMAIRLLRPQVISA